MRKGFLVLLGLLLLLCGTASADENAALYVKKIDGLPEDFILGMDVSSVISLEKSGVTYRDRSGEERDLFIFASASGMIPIQLMEWDTEAETAIWKLPRKSGAVPRNTA